MQMNISKAQGYDVHKLFNKRDSLEEQLAKCRKLEILLVDRFHDPRKEENEKRIQKIQMLIEHVIVFFLCFLKKTIVILIPLSFKYF